VCKGRLRGRNKIRRVCVCVLGGSGGKANKLEERQEEDTKEEASELKITFKCVIGSGYWVRNMGEKRKKEMNTTYLCSLL